MGELARPVCSHSFWPLWVTLLASGYRIGHLSHEGLMTCFQRQKVTVPLCLSLTLQGRKRSENDLSASVIFSVLKVPYFGVTSSELTLPSHLVWIITFEPILDEGTLCIAMIELGQRPKVN